jgi:transglutaminase-like putative cysteine protease/tetratricopeptide (TPR) repeat protein
LEAFNPAVRFESRLERVSRHEMIARSQPRAWFPILLTIVLAASSCLAQQPGKNPYDRKLQQIVADWPSRDIAAKAVALRQIANLRDYIGDAAQAAAALRDIAGRATENPLIRDEANWHLARIALLEGRLDDAREHTAPLGFVTDWLRVPDCPLISAAQGSPVKPGPLASANVHTANHVCVVTAVFAPQDKDVAVRFAANSPATLFFNGNPAAVTEDIRSFAFDQKAIGVRLNAGWNTLALLLSSDADSKQFTLRITAPDGGGLSLKADASQSQANKTPDLRFPASDLLEQSRSEARNPGQIETVAALEQLRGFRPDLADLESAIKSAPTAMGWFAVAQACADQSCRFTALNRALALDANFTEAKAALAAYYEQRGQLEKSRDLLKQALESSPSDFVLRKQLADLYATAGDTPDALSLYRQLEKISPTPLWLKRELALKYFDLGLTAQAATLLGELWKWNFGDEQVRSALADLAQRRNDGPALEMLAQTAEILDPMDPKAALQLARHGEFAEPMPSDDAHEVDVHLQRAQLLAFAGRNNEAHLQLLAASKLDGRIQLPSSLPGTGEDAAYLVDPAQLASVARRTPPAEKSNVVSLADVSIERILASGQSILHAQQVFYIANDRGARDYGVRSIQYSHATQELTTLAARVYKADGRILDANDQGENSVADLNVAMYYDTRSHSFRFPTLEKGDVIYLEYRISPNSDVNPYGNYFGALIAFQNGLPQRLRRYVLIAGSDRKLNVVEQRMPVHAAVARSDGQIVYRWDAANLPPLTFESRGPSLTELAPYVSISTFEDWNQLGRWYARIIAPQFTLDGELRDALTRITANADTEAEKIHAIHEFVLRNTHYVAMEFGIYSYKPYPVSQVFARRFGDCKDKASLMIALMRAAGVDADLALVRTRKMGDVSDRATNLAIFNHAVAYIPKYDLWLDGTAEYAGSRELPLDDQGAMALIVTPAGEATLRRIPVTLPMQNYTHRVVRAELQKDGNILFSGSAYTRGEDAPGLRREYEMADRQRDTVRANLAQVYPSVRVDQVHVEGAENLEQDINVKFSGSLDKFAGNKVLALTSSWLPHQYVNSLAAAMTRSQDLLLPAPWTTEEELHFSIPEGANIETVPTDLNYDTRYGAAVIHYERRGRELFVSTSVQFRKLRITPAEYAGFREFCSQVEKAFRREVKVRLAS